jgi:MerR family transcriptional regulator, heat shock protein HspR
MTRRIIPRELAARELAVSTTVLARYESLGLVQITHEGSDEGYEPAQIRRLWSIVTYQRDLGINLAGVEVILHLVDHLSDVHHRLYDVAEELRELLDKADMPSLSDDAHV